MRMKQNVSRAAVLDSLHFATLRREQCSDVIVELRQTIVVVQHLTETLLRRTAGLEIEKFPDPTAGVLFDPVQETFCPRRWGLQPNGSVRRHRGRQLAQHIGKVTNLPTMRDPEKTRETQDLAFGK